MVENVCMETRDINMPLSIYVSKLVKNETSVRSLMFLVQLT